ncbi:hypothetical protein CP8484711_1958B, partial [Chlamydia psittaci 84-8471/1]
TLLRDLQ